MSNKVKIALIVSICVVVAIVGVVIFSRKSADTPEQATTTAISSEDIYAPSTTIYPTQTPGSSAIVQKTTTTAASTSPSATTSTTSQETKVSASATASATPVQYVRLTNKDQPTVTPYPGSGYFDYTRKPEEKTLDVTIAKDDYEKLTSGDICVLAGIPDSWNDPFSKIVCSVMRFGTEQILVPMSNFICNLQASALNTNYSSNITGRLVGSSCQVLDR